MLKLGDKVLWGVIIPTILVGALLVFPYVELGPSRRYGDRRIGLSGAAVSVYLLASLSFMGSPWYAVQSSADIEVLAELLPQTHPGPVRTTEWEELDLGTFEAADWRAAPTPALEEVLHEFDQALAEHDDELTEAEGVLVVEAWQPDLKKLTFRILWTSAETGEARESSQTTYLHRESNHEITARFGG